MDDTALMRVLDGARRIGHPARDDFHGERLLVREASLQQRLQVRAVDPIEHDEEPTMQGATETLQRDDVRVLEASHQRRLFAEPRDPLGMLQVRPPQIFDGHFARTALPPRAIDLAGQPRTDVTLQNEVGVVEQRGLTCDSIEPW